MRSQASKTRNLTVGYTRGWPRDHQLHPFIMTVVVHAQAKYKIYALVEYHTALLCSMNPVHLHWQSALS